MGIPVTLAQSILGVPWPTFRQIHRLFFPLEDLLRLIWSFLGTIAWRVLGVLFCAFFSVLRALFGALAQLSTFRGDTLLWQSSMAS